MRFLCIGAHPDDCELGFGGTAARLAAEGHPVKFLSVTDGRAGHHLHSPEVVAEIRRKEALEAARRLGIADTEVLDNPDGALTSALGVRDEIIRRIRQWRADVVLTHRPWDYHPDHRYTSQAVQDAAYLMMVPHICADTPALRRNPIFLYLQDGFRLPTPFAPDVAVDIDSSWDRKIESLDAHTSQVYEWLPWISNADALPNIPESRADRLEWLSGQYARPITASVAAALAGRYGGREIRHAEAFQICEYGRRPAPEELDAIFPR
ncbi:MAG TPA: PIG-L deacetylase family protein [Bryobacteraceae bacterium]|nr:PIG-L deacetylase family protein [Bryobacteraceae bacterium]